MARRMRFIVFCGVVTMLVLATGFSAGAAPEDDVQATEAEIAEAQDRLMDLRAEESDALAEYNGALHKMNELNGEIADAEEDLEAAKEELAEAQESLEDRAAQVYKSGNVAFMDVLMGTDDFQEFASRLELWMRLLGQEQAEVEAVRDAKEKLEERKSELETRRVHRVEAVDDALAHKEKVTEAAAEAESYLDSLNGDLQTAIEAEQAREARLAREAAEQAVAERAAESEPVAQPEPDPAAQQAAEEAAAQAQREAEIAAERAAKAEERAAQRDAEEEAEEQAAIEAAAAEQARADARAAAREAEQEAALEAERQAARDQAAADREAEERAALQAERQAARDQAAADREAERAAEEATATATASADGEDDKDDSTATATASADGKKDKKDDSTATATASAAALRSGGGGGPSSCGDDFGGVQPYVAEAGCDLEAKFGLRITGVGLSPYHWDGMDLDVWTSDVQLGNQVRDYALANFDVEYTCWQDHYVNYITGWEETCPGHMDHVHITFAHG